MIEKAPALGVRRRAQPLPRREHLAVAAPPTERHRHRALAQAQRLGGEVTLPRANAAAAPLSTEPLRAADARWQTNLSDTAGVNLVNLADESGEADVAYLTAATMVALEIADAETIARYEQARPRELRRTRVKLASNHWAQLRHPDDSLEIGELIELLAPAIHALAPMTARDLDLDDTQRVADADLPAPFARLRGELAEQLGVDVAPVYARSELGHQIHVGALETPVLLAGDDALTAPERPVLAFALGRATTLLWQGRALAPRHRGHHRRRPRPGADRDRLSRDVHAGGLRGL